jgi:hypothetical protein
VWQLWRLGRWLLPLWVATVGCHTPTAEPGVPLDPVRDGGTFELPPRTVVTDFDAPVGFEAAPPTGVGVSPGNKDAAAANDAGGDASNAADATAPMTCSVLLQNCGATRACYPAGAGVTVCALAGDLGAYTPCGEHTQCAPGLLCVDAFGAGSRQCLPACDTTAATPCPKGDTCRPYAGTLGFCAP